jgi:hypothetical protein
MAITSNTYTGNGSNKLFSITFPYLETTDVDVYLNGVLQTVTTQYTFANATTVEFVAAPGNGVTVVLQRTTQKENLNSTFFPGSSIKAADLNENFDQLLYISQENTDVVNNLPVTVTMLRWKKTATAGQTVLTGNDDNAISLVYTAGFEQVYLNGAHLTRNTDYTASDGATITMSVALLVGDLVEVMAYAPTSIVGTNSTGINFTQSGTGAVTRNVDSKLKESVSVKDFGAVGDGTTDDTTAIQAALNSGARYISGNGLTYVVTTIYPKSLQTISDMRLVRKPSATEIWLQPVVKIGGTGLTVTDVTLQNVVINGNRQNLSNINIGFGEDGGMHGFKIAEGANGIRLINCEASYCGTAGLAIHADTSTNVADYPIKNIYLENFVATYNREHGMFVDSVDGVRINGGVFSFNGQTLAGGFSDTNGNTGFKNVGVLFGSGFDLECYTGYAQSYFKNIYFSDIVCRNNSTPCMIYAPPVVSAVAEIPAQNIFLKNVYFEKGTNAGSTAAFTIYANSFVGTKYGVDTVHLSGFLDGHITSNNARGISFTDGFIKAADSVTIKAQINNGLDTVVTVPSNRDNIQIETFGVPTWTTNTGVGTLSISISQYVKSNGKHSLVMPLSVSGGLISGGNMSWTVTLPSTVKGAINAVVNAWNSTSGKSVIANVSVLSATQVRIFMTAIDDNIQGNLELEVLI